MDGQRSARTGRGPCVLGTSPSPVSPLPPRAAYRPHCDTHYHGSRAPAASWEAPTAEDETKDGGEGEML